MSFILNTSPIHPSFQPSFSCFSRDRELFPHIEKAFLSNKRISYDDLMGGFLLDEEGFVYKIKADCINPFDLLEGLNIVSFQVLKEDFAIAKKISRRWAICKPFKRSLGMDLVELKKRAKEGERND